MREHHSNSSAASGSSSLLQNSAWKGAVIMVGVIAAFYVLREHWGHVLGFAPYLLLLACPLMHLFGHGGHGHHHTTDEKEQRP